MKKASLLLAAAVALAISPASRPAEEALHRHRRDRRRVLPARRRARERARRRRSRGWRRPPRSRARRWTTSSSSAPGRPTSLSRSVTPPRTASTGSASSRRRSRSRTLAVLYANKSQWVTVEGTGVNRMQDLKGRRIATGAPGSGTEIIAHPHPRGVRPQPGQGRDAREALRRGVGERAQGPEDRRVLLVGRRPDRRGDGPRRDAGHEDQAPRPRRRASRSSCRSTGRST